MKRVVFDIAALIARVIIGVIFIAHGWKKWQGGLGATAEGFAESGVPMPQVAAAFTTVAETVGGAMLILGLAVRLAALALLVVTIGAFIFVHAPNGIFVQEGGWEFVGALSAASLLFLALGGGRLGLDGILNATFKRRSQRRRAEQDLADHAPPTSHDRPAEEYRDDTQPLHRDQTGYRDDTPPEQRHNVPRQPSGPRSGGLSDEDMRDVDALVGDEQTRPPKPPNR
ncbi:DoxX family protein [Nonomuraea sp. LPB2021202275-12-8]|uniref:DoxX family protein n=1 Tax=Nonomuraea sp. LPB2021202275-12-8 TaxID=3120159 RepID=UPI00300D4B5D